MGQRGLRIVILGLTITSSWGNGHATTFRGLVRALARRGHEILFLERDTPWYAAARDMPEPPGAETALYDGLDALRARWSRAVETADLVLVGSYVPDGQAIAAWVQATAGGVTAFYDIDTPVTLAAVEAGTCDYLSAELIGGFDLYLSFTGGPTLDELETRWGARAAHPLYCSADPEHYRPEPGVAPRWDLGYLGTYSPDRQPTLEALLCAPARAWPAGRFVVAGSLYPAEVEWPANVERIDHAPPAEHRAFYAGQRWTLNVTRADMLRRGWSPSVRLFEAACCGVPIISDAWPGLDAFFTPGREIMIAATPAEALAHLRGTDEPTRQRIAAAARDRALANHTADHRAAELEAHVLAAARPPARLVRA